MFCTEEGISYAEYIQPESLLMCIEHTTRVVLSAAAVFLDGSCFAVPGSNFYLFIFMFSTNKESN